MASNGRMALLAMVVWHGCFRLQYKRKLSSDNRSLPVDTAMSEFPESTFLCKLPGYKLPPLYNGTRTLTYTYVCVHMYMYTILVTCSYSCCARCITGCACVLRVPQELEIVIGEQHISFTTTKIGSLLDCKNSK